MIIICLFWPQNGSFLDIGFGKREKEEKSFNLRIFCQLLLTGGILDHCEDTMSGQLRELESTGAQGEQNMEKVGCRNTEGGRVPMAKRNLVAELRGAEVNGGGGAPAPRSTARLLLPLYPKSLLWDKSTKYGFFVGLTSQHKSKQTSGPGYPFWTSKMGFNFYIFK